MNKEEAMQIAMKALQEADKTFMTCPICNTGTFGGIFYSSCDNPQCPTYNPWVMKRCYICNQPRRNCSC